MNFTNKNDTVDASTAPRHSKRKLIISIIAAVAVFAIALTVLAVFLLDSEPNDSKPTDNSVYLGDGKLVVYVDPGHGYLDPGADSEYLGELSEKDINLQVALRLADYLKGFGAEVRMTRTSDVPPEGEDPKTYKLNPIARAEIVNGDPEADVFVSVHCDSFPSNTSVRGLRVHYDQNNTKDTPKLSKAIADSATQRLGYYGMPEARLISYNALDGGIYVLRNINVPSVLVELGFLSNASDAYLMLDDKWIDDAALAIAEGVANFFGLPQNNG